MVELVTVPVFLAQEVEFKVIESCPGPEGLKQIVSHGTETAATPMPPSLTEFGAALVFFVSQIWRGGRFPSFGALRPAFEARRKGAPRRFRSGRARFSSCLSTLTRQTPQRWMYKSCVRRGCACRARAPLYEVCLKFRFEESLR
eukprot:4414223-Lingulodinium_polyedra.AAC.1